MRAFGHTRPTAIDDPDAIVALDVPDPIATGHDLLVEVRAVSVNPVDYKVRAGIAPEGPHRILGWDAAGIVRAAGEAVTRFAPGDRVFYAGAFDRPGSNAELQLVDARIAGRMPASASFAEAAALPLTGITAWEMLFDRLALPTAGGAGETLLVVGGGGGVASMAIQLARALTDRTVLATASRKETADWVTALGAHGVADHGKDLLAELARLAPDGVHHVFSTNGTAAHFPALAEIVRPEGRIGLVDDPETFDIRLLKTKSLSLHWEFMFTRSLFGTATMAAQGHLLDRNAELIEAGRIRTTLSGEPGVLSVDGIREAHRRLEGGRVRGKIVLVP